jgi:hypothetical protein
MSAAFHDPFESEPTPIGEQMLVPGVRPVSLRARLQALAAAPLMSMRLQKPCDLGLFDEAARNQLDLFSAPSPKP